MKNLSLNIGFIFILLFPFSSQANIELAKSKLIQGKNECKIGKYEKGINHIIDAAMEIRRSAPKHPINRKYKTALRKCYNNWIKSYSCKQDDAIEHFKNLNYIQKKSFMADKKTKKKLSKKIKKCFKDVLKYMKKQCKTSMPKEESVNLIKEVGKLPTSKKFSSKLNKAIINCRKNIWKTLTKECSSFSSVKFIKKIIYIHEKMPNSNENKKEYEFCLKKQIELSRLMCIQKHKYAYGKKAMKYLFHKLQLLNTKDVVFKSKFKSMINDCGSYKLTLNINLKGKTGGIKYVLPTNAVFYIVKKRNNSIRTCSQLNFKSFNKINSKKCKITVNVNNSKQSKPYEICFTGKINTVSSGKKTILLNFDNKTARNIITEKYQIQCHGTPPTVFSDKLFESLLNKKFKVKIPIQNNKTVYFRKVFDLGQNRKAIFNGKWKLSKF